MFLTTDTYIIMMWYIYIKEYYAALRIDEIMQFAAIWLEMEDIMFCEVKQTKGQK